MTSRWCLLHPERWESTSALLPQWLWENSHNFEETCYGDEFAPNQSPLFHPSPNAPWHQQVNEKQWLQEGISFCSMDLPQHRDPGIPGTFKDVLTTKYIQFNWENSPSKNTNKHHSYKLQVHTPTCRPLGKIFHNIRPSKGHVMNACQSWRIHPSRLASSGIFKQEPPMMQHVRIWWNLTPFKSRQCRHPTFPTKLEQYIW